MKQQENNRILFADKEAFRAWLSENHSTNEGIWLIFGKKNGPKTLTADEAVEEALCFGWIDSQMKSIDDKTYIEYFCPRRKNSKWSERNKTTIVLLETQGRMTDHGRTKVEEAKKNGRWNAQTPPSVSEDQIAVFARKLEGIEPAYSNFTAMSFSVRRTYTLWYLDAKSEQTKITRFDRIVERLNKNLKPM
ncbi:MAG: YdeI/OmpD-associated family protein [Massilibacteroides sp.]|nr:YdeI/OmpD-associated family protein [Massilibacteroides sp.]MDD3061374.1 YdeI/OmpD-associated family protein [Massilibacteroides sp.]MDD4114891.1 YdeI/OmpD-associated family protein [Massilibacteroides sp.]MDD4659465.1 YdeI/OmpD-associated family protein [Massilibacteroides sp.]